MQQYPKASLLKKRITLIRRPKSRNILKIPILTVHNQQKDTQQVDSKSRLKKIFCERFKEKNHIKRVLSIFEKMPSVECSILKNANFKEEIQTTKIGEGSKYKTHYRNPKNLLLNNLRKETECEGDYDKTYLNRLKQRLLKKLSKNDEQQNLSLLLKRRQLSVLRCSLNKRKVLEYNNLRQTLSCRLIPYHNSNILARNNLKKQMISRRSLQKEDKNYKSLCHNLEKRINKKIQEEQLDGWQTYHLNKEGEEFNVCSFNSESL